MEQYIPKSALVAEIERRIKTNKECMLGLRNLDYYQGKVDALNDTILSLNTLEVKEVDLENLREELDKAVKIYKPNGDFGWGTLYNIAVHFFELGVRKKKEEKYEVPSVSKTEDVSVTSRMAMIDDDLKPIAEFILDYAGWNLHKDEWNHPVLEVPLFRVLDALIQRGKPYCGKN